MTTNNLLKKVHTTGTRQWSNAVVKSLPYPILVLFLCISCIESEKQIQLSADIDSNNVELETMKIIDLNKLDSVDELLKVLHEDTLSHIPLNSAMIQYNYAQNMETIPVSYFVDIPVCGRSIVTIELLPGKKFKIQNVIYENYKSLSNGIKSISMSRLKEKSGYVTFAISVPQYDNLSEFYHTLQTIQFGFRMVKNDLSNLENIDLTGEEELVLTAQEYHPKILLWKFNVEAPPKPSPIETNQS